MEQTIKRTTLAALRALKLNRLAGRIYYNKLHGFAPAGKALPEAVTKAFSMAKDRGLLDGADYCEFGIFKGYTFLHGYQVAQRLQAHNMRFFGFDSFEGLPTPSGPDVVTDGQQPFYEGQYACSYEKVHKELDQRGADWSRMYLIKGFFNESLASEEVQRFDIRRIAVALVDCDLYQSTVDVLAFLGGRMLDGAIVLMDDWKSFGEDNDKGQPLAMAEFARLQPQWNIEPLFDYGSYSRVFSFSRSDAAHSSLG